MSSEVLFEGAQKAAVTHDKGPMLVLAGPGSGKTFTITHRIKYLTEECSVCQFRHISCHFFPNPKICIQI